MRRRITLAVALTIVLIAGGLFILAVRRSVEAGGIYTVALLQDGLHRHPAEWVGRTILVRSSVPYNSNLDAGLLGGSSCATARAFILVPALERGMRDAIMPSEGPLPLVVPGCGDPLLAPLRRVPLVSNLLPRAQVLHFGVPVTLRVRIERAPTSFPLCPAQPCYRAILLDPSPVQPSGFVDPSVFLDPNHADAAR